MIKKHWWFLFILCICSFPSSANFVFNSNCIEAYEAIVGLRINEGRLLIQKEKQQNPKNGIVVLLDNYADYFSLLASDSKLEYQKLNEFKSSRLSALEKNDSDSPYYLYSQAEVYLQWGLIKAKFGDYMSSAIDIKRAKALLKTNEQKYPGFLPAQKCAALINVIFGSTPSNLKAVTQFLGMTGNVQEGIKQLENLRTAFPKTKYSFYKDELIFFLCYVDIDVLHNKKNYGKLLGYLEDMEEQSLLKAYLKGYVAAKTAHNEEAIKFLQACPSSSKYADLPAIDYLLGNAKLNRMDSDAYVFFNRYLKSYKGTNYIKDSYLKLAFFYLLHNDFEKYSYYLKMVKTQGFATDEKDKQALKEATDAKPDINLLKARLFFDGGYYNKALAQLQGKEVTDFKLLRDRIEFQYRLGRIYDKLERFDEALISYQKTIYLGKATSYYFAANSALRMANIFEQRNDKSRAASFYHQAIDMKNHEYENSIETEAKEGLKRIGR